MIKQADQAMDNSVSNIQLTARAKRIIEREIAYQTSGQGFWWGMAVNGFLVLVWGLLVLTAMGFCLYGALNGNIWGAAWSVVSALFFLIPVSGFGVILRATKSRRAK